MSHDKKLSDDDILALKRQVVAGVPAEAWREIEAHKHETRTGRTFERLHPTTNFTLSYQTPDDHKNAESTLGALDTICRVCYRTNPDEVYTTHTTHNDHPELLSQGFADQMTVEVQLKHADILKETLADCIEADLETNLRQILHQLSSPSMDRFVALAGEGMRWNEQLTSDVQTARYTLGLYLADEFIPFAEVQANLANLVGGGDTLVPSPTPGAETDLHRAADQLSHRIVQGRYPEGESRDEAYDALGVAQHTAQSISTCLQQITHLRNIGVGRWHTSGHSV